MADIGNLTIAQQLAGLTVGSPRNITSQHMRNTVLSIDNKINLDSGGDLKSDGTVSLTAPWNMGAVKVTANQFESVIISGTPPFIIASTDLVANLNADRVDGIQGADFLRRNGSVPLTTTWDAGAPTIKQGAIQGRSGFALQINRGNGGVWASLSNASATSLFLETIIVDNNILSIGTGSDIQFKYSTVQTNNGLLIGMQGSQGNYIIFTDKLRISSNFAIAAQSNPTVFFHDGSVTLTNFGSIKHNGTNLEIASNVGSISIGANLIPDGDGTRDFGSDSLAWQRGFINNVQPTNAPLALEDDAGAIKIEISTTGIGFFATVPVVKAAALTAEDATVINSTYDAIEEGILNNVRTRLGELESRFQTYGLLN